MFGLAHVGTLKLQISLTSPTITNPTYWLMWLCWKTGQDKKPSPFRRSIMAHFSMTGQRASIITGWMTVCTCESSSFSSMYFLGASWRWFRHQGKFQNDLWEVRFCGYDDEALMFGSAWMTNQIRDVMICDVMWDSNTNGLLRIACLIQVLTDTTWYNSSSTISRSPGLGSEDEWLGTWKSQTTPPSGISFMMYLWFISPHEMEQIQVLICFDTESPQFSPYFEPVFSSLPSGKHTKKIMENHHFSWLNQLFPWPFSIAFCRFARV